MKRNKDWKLYEDTILKHFQEVYPDHSVLADQRIVGTTSGRKRQIDILISGEIAGFDVKIVIDCKHFSKNVDVKTVEAFIGMLADVQASKGVIITNVGYTKAAIQRAKADTRDIQLDILDFEDLPQFSGVQDAIISKWNEEEYLAALFSCPFGWIVHETPQDGLPAGLTKNTVSWDKGWASREVIYANLFSKTEFPTLEDIFETQEKNSQEDFPGVEFEYFHDLDERLENVFADRIVLRVGYYPQYPETETSVFVDFGTFYAFFVLITPKVTRDKNMNKLAFVVRTTIPQDLPNRNAPLPLEYFKFFFFPYTNTDDDIDRSQRGRDKSKQREEKSEQSRENSEHGCTKAEHG